MDRKDQNKKLSNKTKKSVNLFFLVFSLLCHPQFMKPNELDTLT